MYRKFNLFLFTFVLITILPASVFGQDDSRIAHGSFYSGFGFGIPADLNSPNTSGMGLTGVSTYLGYSANIANPAQWGLIGFTHGTLSAALNRYDASDNFADSRNSHFAIDNFQLVIPVLRNRLGVSASFSPMFRSDFRQRDQGTFNPIPDVPELGDDIDFLVSTIGSGGINRFEVGLGYSLFNNVSIGYGFSVNLLTINNDVISDFSDQQFRVTQYNRSIDGNSIGHRFGIYAFKGRLFGSTDQLSFGATITLPSSIEAERTISSFRIVDGRRVLLQLEQDENDRTGNIKLPLEFNTGLTYNFNYSTNIVAELLVQRWDNAEFSFNTNQQGYFKNRVRTGIGFQYHPYRSERQRGILSNLKYSVGTSYDNGHLSIQGQDIETVFLNAGIGLMSQRIASSIDLSFHYGIRGTHSSNLVKEDIWGFKLSLNLAEFMFVRQRFQ